MNEGAQWEDMLELGFFFPLLLSKEITVWLIASQLHGSAEEEGGGVRRIPTLRMGI